MKLFTNGLTQKNYSTIYLLIQNLNFFSFLSLHNEVNKVLWEWMVYLTLCTCYSFIELAFSITNHLYMFESFLLFCILFHLPIFWYLGRCHMASLLQLCNMNCVIATRVILWYLKVFQVSLWIFHIYFRIRLTFQ